MQLLKGKKKKELSKLILGLRTENDFFPRSFKHFYLACESQNARSLRPFRECEKPYERIWNAERQDAGAKMIAASAFASMARDSGKPCEMRA